MSTGSTGSAVVRDLLVIGILFVGIPGAIVGVGYVGVRMVSASLTELHDEPEVVEVAQPAPEPEPLGGLVGTLVHEAETDAPVPVGEMGTSDEEAPQPVGGLGVAGSGEPEPMGEATADTSAPEPQPEPEPAAAEEDLGYVAKLRKRDITQGVKRNAVSLEPCLREAQDSGTLRPGKYRLVLDFVIEPSGSVGGVRLRKPKRLRGNVVGTCLTTAVEGWRFPRSDAGAPIKNFPIPFTVR